MAPPCSAATGPGMPPVPGPCQGLTGGLDQVRLLRIVPGHCGHGWSEGSQRGRVTGLTDADVAVAYALPEA